MTKRRWVGDCSWLLLLGACGTAGQAELGESEELVQAEAERAGAEASREIETAALDRELWGENGSRLPGPIDGRSDVEDAPDESVQVVDKQFIDGSLSCNSLPDLACPDITVSAPNGNMVLVDASTGLPLIFPRNPVVTVREVHPARRAGVNLDSISCDLDGSGQPLREFFQFRLPVEIRASAISSATIRFTQPAFPQNYPGGTMDTFTCLPRTFTLSAPGFRSRRVQFQGRYFGHRMVADAQTVNTGIGTLEVACDYSVGGSAGRVEADRPRDVVAVNGARFTTAATLSSSQTEQRCNAMCGDDCAITFGADPIGAQDCISVCTPECVSRATTSTNLCQDPGQCDAPCAHPSDCGDRNAFTCASGCCVPRIF